jgi:Flp pilus assembly protein TadG
VLLAEDAALLAFRGSTSAPDWLSADEAESLVDTPPEANVPPDLAIRQARTSIEGLPDLTPALNQIADERAMALGEAHRRVRDAARSTGTVTVSAQKPVDVLGVYVILPIAAD